MRSPLRQTLVRVRTRLPRRGALPRPRDVLLPPSPPRIALAVALAFGVPLIVAATVGHMHRGLAAFALLAVVVAAALVGRFACGAVAAVVTALGYLYWFAPPEDSFAVTRETDLDSVVIFFCISLLVSLIAGLQQASFASVERQAHDFEAAATGLKELLDGVDAIVWRCDAEFRITFVSQSVERILGFSREEVVGDPGFWLDHLHEEDRDRIVADARARVAAGEGYEHEYRLVAADGRTVWIRNIVRAARGPDGTSVELRGISIDVSEAKRLEEELRQSQKMEAIGQLAGGVAHDFNNLLTVILGHAALALADPPETPFREELDAIRTAAERAAALTQQLLAFRRKQLLRPTVVDLNEVVVSVDRLLRRAVGDHIVVRTDAPPAPVPVQVDRTQIEQVLVNLALNARDAMPAGGELRIAVSPLELAGADAVAAGVEPGRYARLVVSDDGHGMDDGTRARAFDPFFTTKPAGSGTGLGLSTVYGIVRQTGGAISVDTAEGAGATFTILLPRAPGAPSPPPPARGPAPARSRGGTVLLVEDEELVRTVVGEMLESRGYRVLATADAAEAAALFAESDCDVLVTDVVMPGESGVELARRLTALRPGLRVLYVSGYTRGASPLGADLAPGSAFLQKPFTIDALERALDELLRPTPPAAPPAGAARRA